MDQHPVPRQITTFEFKLIGFMTLRQFLYLVIYVPLGFVLWKLVPIPLLNILLGLACVLFGIALAFLPINDRPLDVWVRNFIKRLQSPTQYVYQKHNTALYFLHDLYFVNDPHKVMSHIESREKLAAYLTKTKPPVKTPPQKQQVQVLLQTTTSQLQPVTEKRSPFTVHRSSSSQDVSQRVQANNMQTNSSPVGVGLDRPEQRAGQDLSLPQQPNIMSQPKQPFFVGSVKNSKKIPLPGIMVYVKDVNNAVVRILKTNPHGIFATYNALPEGEYAFEVKDPKGGYFFDTMKFKVASSNPKPFEVQSKEML